MPRNSQANRQDLRDALLPLFDEFVDVLLEHLATRHGATKATAQSRRDDPLMDQDEASVFLKVPVPTLVRWRYERKAKHPPYIKVGQHVRYDRQQLKAWLEKNSVNLNRNEK